MMTARKAVRLVVAPFAGAWVETAPATVTAEILQKSRPSRARGLKLHVIVNVYGERTSRPSRARGLKLRRRYLIGLTDGVAPFAGAWVETLTVDTATVRDSRRALRGRVG